MPFAFFAWPLRQPSLNSERNYIDEISQRKRCFSQKKLAEAALRQQSQTTKFEVPELFGYEKNIDDGKADRFFERFSESPV